MLKFTQECFLLICEFLGFEIELSGNAPFALFFSGAKSDKCPNLMISRAGIELRRTDKECFARFDHILCGGGQASI